MTTPYSASLPGLDEARLAAIKALIVANVTLLNSALAVGSLTPLVFTSAMVEVGDSDYLPGTRIRIVGGGEDDGTDLEATPYLSGVIYQNKLITNIYVYLHPDDLGEADQPDWAYAQELARARICDTLRKRVFNHIDNTNLTLTSKEGNGTDFDVLKGCHVRQIIKGVAPKSIGRTVIVNTAHLIHEGEFA